MTQYIWGDSSTQFFSQLSPDLILNSVEQLGLKTTGRYLTLNSMENRVYEIEVESDDYDFVIGKFYRPGRWTKQQILEEHRFLLQLQEEELPVIAPLVFSGETLFLTSEHDLWFTLFPKKGGRLLDELNDDLIDLLGRMVGRMHSIGKRESAEHRLKLTPQAFGLKNLEFLLQEKKISFQFEARIKELVEGIYTESQKYFDGVSYHRIHGDLHRGNVINRDGEIYCIDFDDMLQGPAVQDIWLLIPGDDEESKQQRFQFLEQYETFCDFDYQTLNLIEPLRALRYIHFAAWIGKRWEDQAFQRAFPYYGTDQYWSTLSYDLHLQLEKITDVTYYNY